MTTATRLRPDLSWQQGLAVLFCAAGSWVLVREALGGGAVIPLLAVLAVGALALLARTREAAIVWLVLCASVFPSRLLPLSVAGVRTDLAELLGLGLVGAVVARAALGERFRVSRFTGPLVLVVLAAAFGAYTASANGAARDSWLGLLKTFLLYLVPLAFVALFSSDEDRDRLERWVHRICTVGGAFVLASAALGFRVPTDDLPEVVTLGVATEALRLRPALLVLTGLAVLLLTARTAVHGMTRGDLARFVIYTAVIAASFTRSTWVPLVLVLALFALLRPGRRRPLRGLQVVLALTTVTAVSFSLAAAGTLGATPAAIVVRVQSIGSDEVLEENSYRDREIETTNARQRLSEDPVRGVGLGQPYGAVRRVYDSVTGAGALVPRRFIHNSILGLWLWTGLLGLVALLWFAVRVVTTSVTAARFADEARGARAVAAGLALLALGMQSTFQTSLTSRSVLATVACAIVFLDLPGLVRRRP